MKIRKTTMAAAQARYDAMEPGDSYEGQTFYACDCGEEWGSDDHDSAVCQVCLTDEASHDVTDKVVEKLRQRAIEDAADRAMFYRSNY